MKKTFTKILSVVLCAVMVLGAAPLGGLVRLDLPKFNFFGIQAEAREYCLEGYFTYYVENDTATVTSVDDSFDGALTIPSTIGGYQVTKVSGFNDKNNITSVYIPDSVLELGGECFSQCKNLESVRLSNNLTAIPDDAFRFCYNLKSIDIPDSVTKIGRVAFRRCWSLSSISIGSKVEYIGSNAFENTAFISDSKNYIDGVLYVGKYVLAVDSTKRSSCVLRDGTEVVAENTFMWSNFSDITFPRSLVETGGGFLDCNNLENVYYKGSLSEWCNLNENWLDNPLYEGANLYVNGNELVENLVVSKELEENLSDSFCGCLSIKSVTFLDGVKSTGDYSFYKCNNLQTINLPSNEFSIGERTFSECGIKKLPDFNYPVSIGNTAFSNCDFLTLIEISNNIISIDNNAFTSCKNIEKIVLDKDNFSIRDIGLYNCEALKTIQIGDSVTSIPNGCFMRYKYLNNVIIPKSVKSINARAFMDCSSLTDVYYGGTEEDWNKITIGSYNNPLKNATIHYNSAGGNPTPDNPNELTLVSTYPANGATQLAYDDDLVLTFNMNVERNLSTLNEDGICIGIYDYKTDELVKSFDELYVGYKHSGKTMTFEDAFRKLEPGKKYYIKIADDAIYSKATDKTLIYKGINNKDQWSFSYLNPTQKQGYSLDIYSSDRAITVSKGETQQVSVVLSLDGKPCKQDGISLSVANNGVAEISKIERENDRTVVTLKGLKNGTTTVTVTDNGSKTVKKLPVFVTDEASVYYFTDVEKYTEYNPMIVDDMFIDSFKHKKNDNGSYTVTFDVYNMGHSCGAVDVYDKNGNVVDSQIIELFDSDYPTDLFSHAEYAGKLVGNFALDIITGDLLYSVNNIKSDLNSKQTSVSVTVPENGYYVITKNVTASNSCLLYNALTLALDVAFESVGLIVDATDVAEELAQGVLSKNVDKYLKKICETFIEKGALLSAKNASIMAENLIADVEELFKAMGTTFIDAVIEAVPKVTTKITKEQAAKVFFGMSLKQCGKDIVDNILYGSIKAAKWVAICQNIYDYRNSNGAYVYASQNGNTKTSNGVIAKSDSDAQTVFHSILVTSGYYVDYIDAMHRPEADAELYSISMIKNGQKVQPSSPVTIYIPIPDGWGSEKIYIYHIKDNFEREELEGTIENGYIKFVTNGFSYFVIANDVVNFIDEFSIKPYSIATVNYGDTLMLQADLGEATLPEGWSIQWTVEGSGFNMTTEENGMKCKFTSVANGNATIKATLVNESGEAILDAEDNEISNEITLKSNASFWQKIVSFFKNLFRINRIIY